MKRLVLILMAGAAALALMTGCGKKGGEHANVAAGDANAATANAVAALIPVRVIHLMDRPVPVDTLKSWDSTEELLKEFLWSEREMLDNQCASLRLVCHSPLPDSMVYSEHPFIDGVRYAYANHHPMVINPDVVWLTIEQGFALHVKHYAEELRHLFVDHEGKKQLMLYCAPGLINEPYSAWEPYFPQFTDSIAAWTKDSIARTLIADFSTTDATALVASQIGLMSAMQHYFDYVLEAACGIPDIYLEGSAADWRHLAEKTERLRYYQLDWWVDELLPVIGKIAESAEGEPDLDFWRQMYRGVRTDTLSVEEIAEFFEVDLSEMSEEDIQWMKEDYYMGGCGGGMSAEDINGWITVFYPYYSYADSPEKARIDWAHFDESTLEDLPLSRTMAPLRYVEEDGRELQLTLHAGLFTFTEDSLTRAIRPTIGWMISRSFSEEEVKAERAREAAEKAQKEAAQSAYALQRHIKGLDKNPKIKGL